MPFLEWKAGMKLTPERLTQMQTKVISVTDTQVVNNSNVFVEDEELTVALEANAEYIVEFRPAFTSASAASDIITAWSTPTGATGTRLCIGSCFPAASFTSATDTRATFTALPMTNPPHATYNTGTGDTQFIWESAYVTTTDAGVLTFMWAQRGATAADTTRVLGSHMKVQRFA